MRVGILSMQQITNYGSFLQAYGLKSMIENMGHNVEFINIIPGEQLPQYHIDKFHNIKLMLRRLRVKRPLTQLRCTLKLHKRFDREFKPELGVKKNDVTTHYDVVVIGSDEVFNVAQSTWFGFSPQLFGEGLNADKVISYAGCFGATTIDKLRNLGIDERIGNLLRQMKTISVRDKNSSEVVSALTGIIPYLHVDPVIAYDFGKEIRLPEIKDEYMLIYTYPGRINNPEEIETITSYAREHNLRMVAIGNYFDWVDEVVTPHPFEVLGYFKKANCIVTDTFHGTVMSLKYNRPFGTIVRGMNSNKLSGLLEQFSLSHRIISNTADLKVVLESPIDYQRVNDEISAEQVRSKEYLNSQL